MKKPEDGLKMGLRLQKNIEIDFYPMHNYDITELQRPRLSDLGNKPEVTNG